MKIIMAAAASLMLVSCWNRDVDPASEPKRMPPHIGYWVPAGTSFVHAVPDPGYVVSSNTSLLADPGVAEGTRGNARKVMLVLAANGDTGLFLSIRGLTVPIGRGRWQEHAETICFTIDDIERHARVINGRLWCFDCEMDRLIRERDLCVDVFRKVEVSCTGRSYSDSGEPYELDAVTGPTGRVLSQIRGAPGATK